MHFVSLALVDTPVPPTLAQWVAFWVQVAALALLAAFAIFCLRRLKSAMDEKTISVETSWGGLGGSLGGWSASNSLTWFIATLVAAILFFALALNVPSALTPTPPEQKKEDQQKKGVDKKDDNKDGDKGAPGSSSAADQTKPGDNNPQGPAKPSSPSPTPK